MINFLIILLCRRLRVILPLNCLVHRKISIFQVPSNLFIMKNIDGEFSIYVKPKSFLSKYMRNQDTYIRRGA